MALPTDKQLIDLAEQTEIPNLFVEIKRFPIWRRNLISGGLEPFSAILKNHVIFDGY